MHSAGPSLAVPQGRKNGRRGRKVPEAFVPWKRTADVLGRQQHLTPLVSTLRGRDSGRGKENSQPQRSTHEGTVSSFTSLSARKERVIGRAQLPGTSGRPSKGAGHAPSNDGDVVLEMLRGRHEANEAGARQSRPHEDRQVSINGESSSERLLQSIVRTVPREIFSRNISHRFGVLKNVVGEGEEDVELLKPGRQYEEGVISGHTGKGNSLSGGQNDDDDDETVAEGDEDYVQENLQCSQPRPQELMHHVGYLNEDLNDKSVTYEDYEEDQAEEGDEGGDDEEDDGIGMQEFLYPTEEQMRKERRKERAWLEKEGERRRAEGKPRNFLLVDERTGMPYGVGVGDWRKELMLLSRDLDPAVGNINRQPEGVVEEIADWIKHTWEYSSPPKFECVKEVIARGVTLRHGDLWKRIRNGEDKPVEVSDRTWLTLRKQLENPASIRKSESCHKANASRVNFGRTGPSGEIGLRQTMKRTLRRSPDPDEVRYEMARNKGFTRRQQMKKNDVGVMQGRGRFNKISADVPRICAPMGNSQECSGDNQREGTPINSGEEEGSVVRAVQDRGEKESGATVSALSLEQLSEHPFVAMMMQRLQALEAKQKNTGSGEVRETGDEVHIPGDAVESVTGQEASSMELQIAVDLVKLHEAEGTRTSKRLRKKAQGQ